VWLGSLVVPVLALATWSVASTHPATAASNAGSGSTCAAVANLDPSTFPAAPVINNTFQPMAPGTQWLLDGQVIDKSGVKHAHRIQTTVTDLTKDLAGVRTILIHEVDLQDGQLQESELYFVAQDNSGNIWTFGEYPEEYSGGKLTGAPASWLTGVAGAHAGWAILGKPVAGGPVYLQGLAPSVKFEDCASVFQMGQHICNGTTCYDNVMITDEYAPNDPAGGHQRKYYAPGIGTVKVGAASGVDPETLTLSATNKLCAPALASIRQQATDQDGRSQTVAKGVYGGTPPAAKTLAGPAC
jgi:hypothetical protein